MLPAAQVAGIATCRTALVVDGRATAWPPGVVRSARRPIARSIEAGHRPVDPGSAPVLRTPVVLRPALIGSDGRSTPVTTSADRAGRADRADRRRTAGSDGHPTAVRPLEIGPG